uniref:Gluconokinase n=1 Tax=Panagrellus redivivus TaxID=6233 RepID=A0A7E4V5E1_PANRE
MPLPTLIVIGGTSGCGKSTVSQALTTQLEGYSYLDGDAFHPASNIEKMAHGIPLNDEDRAGWLQILSELPLKGEKRVLACSALKKKYRDVLGQHCPPPGIRIFLLTLPKNVLLERLATRKGHYAKPNLLDSQLADFELPQEGEEKRVFAIDGHRPVVEVVEEILAILNRDRDD